MVFDKKMILLLFLLLIAMLLWGFRFSGPDNGFDLSNSLVPKADIYAGGPAKDGIPAIDKPKWIAASKANYLQDDDRIMGYSSAGHARAYPIKILNWHEIVNDRIGDQSLLVTFCPLCGTGMAFEVPGQDLKNGFGVSGLLYQSDMLLYDRATDSLWSQIESKAIAGERVGEELTQVPMQVTTWSDWKARYPESLVLSSDTGYSREYDRDPYEGYASSKTTYFPVPKVDPRYHPKEQVVGLVVEGQSRAWPFSELSRSASPLRDELNGKALFVEFDAEHRRASITDEQGKPLASTVGFWFAWMAFHPGSSVYSVR